MAEWKIKANKRRSAISNLNNDEDAHFSLPGKANQTLNLPIMYLSLQQ